MSNLSNFTIFAIRDNNIENISSKCNTVLELLNIWSIKNRLTINYDKTEFMIFSNREHEVEDSFISIDQNSIQSVKDYKFLGVLIDDKLPFRTHMYKVLSKVCKSAGLLYKLRNCFSPDARLSYYYSFMYQHLNYDIATWGKAHKTIRQ